MVCSRVNWPTGVSNAPASRFEKASRPESARGFVPAAKRWVVEPVRRCGSIAWTNYFRRITKNYEHTVSSSVSWLYLANSQLMLQRIETHYQI